MEKGSVLLIYTGGTIGMMEDEETGSLIPFDFDQLSEFVPELEKINLNIQAVSFKKPIDSSSAGVSTWVKIARFIESNYNDYDGFVVLHGTDTMAYTASALSFIFDNLDKAVIITGSQLPIGKLRTDGRENLVSALEMAAAKKNGESILKEVCVYFGSTLYRGNRSHKYSTEDFDAIKSANYSSLAEVGVHIIYKHHRLLESNNLELVVHDTFETNVGVLKLFPGMTREYVKGIVGAQNLKGLIIETYGAGNALGESWFLDHLRELVRKGIKIVNVTQCNEGFVEQGRYQSSSELNNIGVISAADMTFEAALTKLMFLLGQDLDDEEFELNYTKSIRGELTSYSKLG